MSVQDSINVVGMDLGDRHAHLCVVSPSGEELEETRISTTKAGLEHYFGSRAPMRVVIETGTHSGWVGRKLVELGHEVVVANARRLRMIYQSDRKNDKADARMLARVARLDPTLLHPVTLRSEQTNQALAVIRARDGLVKARTQLINAVRGLVKAQGSRLLSCAADVFHKRVGEQMTLAGSAVSGLVASIEKLSEEIAGYDARIEELTRAYPQTEVLRQVKGVGPITALAYVLTLEDPTRFRHSRDVGAYLGLCPRQDQSGQQDRQLRITKAGDVLMRRLLVSAAHYILGPFGPDSDLRRFGEKLCERGGKNAKKRAVVAVARKLAVLLHRLWKTGEVYEPLYQARLSGELVAASG